MYMYLLVNLPKIGISSGGEGGGNCWWVGHKEEQPLLIIPNSFSKVDEFYTHLDGSSSITSPERKQHYNE